jgi:hypothetical protein
LRLTVADINGARGHVPIRDAKGSKDRLVPLPTATHQLLRRFWQRHRTAVLLFPKRRGLNRRIPPHSVRHADATHPVEVGVKLTEVQGIVGHRSIRTTVRYTHPTDQTKHHAIDRINANGPLSPGQGDAAVIRIGSVIAQFEADFLTQFRKRPAPPPVKRLRCGASSWFSRGGRDGQGRGTGGALATACGGVAGERRHSEGVL